VDAATFSGWPYQSDWLVLPMTIAPASRSFRAMNESFVGFTPLSGNHPPVVGISTVSNTSFNTIGTPWSGPRGPFALRSASSAFASSRAFGLR